MQQSREGDDEGGVSVDIANIISMAMLYIYIALSANVFLSGMLGKEKTFLQERIEMVKFANR